MTPSQIILAVKACALLVVLAFVYWLGGQSGRTELAEYKTKVMASTAKAADLATKAERLAREEERSRVLALAELATQYERDRINAQTAADRTIAGLRAGTDKLRTQWQGCKATGELSGASARASGSDGYDRLREEDLRNVLGWAELLQAQRDNLRKVTEADRK